MLPALATPAQLAPLVGLTAAAMQADPELTARAQAALNAASSNVRDAAGNRTFLDVDGETPVMPDKILTVVLDAARRAYILYGTDGSYTSTDSATSDDYTESHTRNLDSTVIAGAGLTEGEIATCGRYAPGTIVAGAYSVPLGTPY